MEQTAETRTDICPQLIDQKDCAPRCSCVSAEKDFRQRGHYSVAVEGSIGKLTGLSLHELGVSSRRASRRDTPHSGSIELNVQGRDRPCWPWGCLGAS